MIKNPVYPFMVDKGKFDKDKFVDVPKIALYPRSTLRFCISVDYGTVNPCSMGLWCLFGGDWYRITESYFDSRKAGFQKTDEEHYSRLCALAGNRHICFVIVDPSAASFIEVIKRHKKFNVIPATNDLNQGLYDVSYLLQTGRIKICKNCEITKREFAQYEFDDNFKPIKQNDHAMDDIRYFVSTLFRTIGVNKMCEYCRCIGNNHATGCPNAFQTTAEQIKQWQVYLTE